MTDDLTFTYRGRTFPMFDHPYNTTIKNERAVEVPLALDMIGRTSAPFVLEVGNVLGHYGYSGHTVVDKYEVAEGVQNKSVFDIEQTFDTIISISTVEHVGFDLPDEPDPAGGFAAIKHLKEHLHPEGMMLITVPLGYNPHLDKCLLDWKFGKDVFTHECTLVRDGEGWVQTPVFECQDYGPWANSLYVGVVE